MKFNQIFHKPLVLLGISCLVVTAGILLGIFGLSGTAYASGGIGPGGGGGCTSNCGTGNYTWYGFGWAKYQTNGNGPTEGFNNNITWQQVQQTCKNTSQVYMFIINDGSQPPMDKVYDYQSDEATFSPYFSPIGGSVDNGRATSITIDTAYSAYQNISNPPYNVDKTGYTWGSNVGWFCYGYVPPTPTSSTLSGLVYFYNGTGSEGLAGVPITTCTSATVTTSGNASGNGLDPSGGGFSFTETNGTGFCIRVPTAYTAPDGTVYGGLQITPGDILPNSPSSGAVANCLANTTSYENQTANSPDSNGGCNYGINDTQYNIAYTTSSLSGSGPTLSGLVYYYDGTSSVGLAGIPISTCTTAAPTTTGNAIGSLQDPSGGSFSFTEATGTGFCIRVPATYTAPDGIVYGGPEITPASELPNSPPGGTTSTCTVNGSTSTSSYEWQIANSPNSNGPCDYGINDGSYNIAYTTATQPSSIMGKVESLTCSRLIGWAFDQQSTNQSLQIDVYLNGPSGSGQNIYSGDTNIYRASVNAAYGIYGNHGFSIDISAYTLNPTNKFYIYATSSGSPAVLLAGGMSVPSSCGPPPPPPSPCPLPPFLSANQTVSVTIPNAPQPSGTSTTPPPSTTTSPGPYSYATPGQMEINSANDQYTNPTNITWTPIGYQNGNNFTLSYSNYIQQYPYDDHQTTINYTQKYNETDYNTQFDYYDCGGGSYIGGGYCQQTYSSSYYSGCASYDSYGNCTSYNACSYPYSGSGGYCNYSYAYYYAATPVYSYYVSNGPYTDYSNANYNGAPALPEICPRNFDIQPPTKTDVTSVVFSGGTADNPNTVTINTNTESKFTLHYGIDNLRHPMLVNGIQYFGNYYIEHANGSKTLLANDNAGPFNIGSTYVSGGTADYPYSKSYSITMPPMAVGDQVCAQFMVKPAHGQINEFGAIKAGTASGTQSSSPIPTGTSCSGPIENQPYSRAYGNDVSAGPQFSGTNFTCDPHNAQILANQDDSGPQPRGSGDQFAVMALNKIQFYASAFLRTIGQNPIAVAPNGLTLANYPSSISSASYGGYFNSSPGGCPTILNYYAQKPANVTLQSPPTGSSYYKLSYSGLVSGQHLKYIDGNVYIPNNIDFAPATIDPTTGKVSGTSLYVIVRGNIYIGPGVTNLDGIYVAENSCDVKLLPAVSCGSFNAQNGGLINTCSDINGGTPSKYFALGSFYDSCGAQLTIRGALIGDQVKLDRTYGSIRNSLPGENPLSFNPHDCSLGNYLSPGSPPNNMDCSAEIFNFDPINYSTSSGINSNQKITYDSILSLPPVL